MKQGLGLLLVACAGCAASGPVTVTPRRVVDRGAAEAAVRKIVQAEYAAMEKPDPDAWAASFAPDSFFFGARPDEAMPSRALAVAEMHKRTDAMAKAGGSFAVRSTALQLGLAGDSRAAWVSDVLEVTLTVGAKQDTQSLRVTEVLAEQDGSWWVLALHWSVALPNERALELAAQKKLGPLPEVAESIEPGAQALAAEFLKSTVEVGEFLTSLSQRPDAFIFGTAPDEQILGGPQIHDAFAKQIEQHHLTIARRGGLRAGVTPSGSVGWVAANLELGAVTDGKKVRVPTRGLMVYLNENGLWKLVQGHFSNGVTE